MKKIFAIGLLVVVLCSTALAAPKQVFRDLAWGDPVDKLGNVTPLPLGSEHDAAGVDLYMKVNDDLQLGPLKARTIIYGFFQDRLFTILIEADDARMLSEVAKAKYGKPVDSNPFVLKELYISGDVACQVEGKVFEEGGTMSLMSVPMAFEYEEWQKEQIKAASEAF